MKYEIALEKLKHLHKRFSARYKIKPNEMSFQINEMWSYNNPPDILLCTPQADALSKAFHFEFDEKTLILIYDLDLHQAALFLCNYLEKTSSE